MSHSKVLSLYAVITTGIGVSGMKSAVFALKALQNSMMFRPCCPSAGPTGGAGFAAPAEIMSLIFARTGRDMMCVTPAAARIENEPVPVSCRARGVLTLENADDSVFGLEAR